MFFLTKRNYKLLGYEKYSLFNPINIILLYSFVSVPHIFYLLKGEYNLYTPVPFLEVDSTLHKYIFFQIISIILFIIGTKSYLNTVFKHYFQKIDSICSNNLFGVLNLLLVLFYVLFIINLGKIDFASLYLIFIDRNKISAELGFAYRIQQVLGYLIIFLFLNKDKLQFKHKIIFSFFLLTFFMSSLLSGGRTQIVYILFFILITLNNKNNWSISTFLKPKYLVLMALVLATMIILPKLRTSDVVEGNYIEALTKKSNTGDYDNMSILSDISGLDRYLFVIYIFDKNGYWLGDGYMDIWRIVKYNLLGGDFVEFLPKGDDGLYLARMSYENRYVEPHRVPDDYLTSFPTGNYFAYMNFGPIGLFIAFFLLGAISKMLYDGIVKNRFNYIYFYTLFASGSIAFSNLSVLNFIFNIATLLIVQAIMVKLIPKKLL